MENKKHILFISSWYPNRNNPTHGIFNRHFAEAASLYNNISILHVCSDENLKAEFEFTEENKNDIFTLTVYYKKIKPRFPFFSAFKKKTRVTRAFEFGYEKLLTKRRTPDLIQLNVIMPMGIGVYHLSHKYNIPYIINECWSGYCEEDGNYKGFALQYYTRKIVKEARAIMPTSDYLKEAMLKHNLNGNYFIVPNVVDVNLFKPAQHIKNDAIRFIHISSLNDREKNVSGIIRAFGKALLTNPVMELVIVGEGVDAHKYRELVRKLKLGEEIKFLGRLASDQIVKEINFSDALLMFSNYETFGVVIIESFACGRPVVTSNAGAIKGYMRHEFGITVNRKDELALTKAILEFTEQKNKFNSDVIRQFAVNNYSYEKIGEKLAGIYTFALQKD
jgi:glycosyltransferase involved in cell wall biosynthesis